MGQASCCADRPNTHEGTAGIGGLAEAATGAGLESVDFGLAADEGTSSEAPGSACERSAGSAQAAFLSFRV